MSRPWIFTKQPMPRFLAMLGGYFGWDERTQRQVWHAIRKAHGTAVVEWRQALLLFEETQPQTPAIMLDFLVHQSSPQRLLAVLEAVEGESGLAREEAQVVIGTVLNKTRADGTWK